jgi:hypothetical protein
MIEIVAAQARSLEVVGQPGANKRTLPRVGIMSALPPKADVGSHDRDVRFVPILLQKAIEAFSGQ